MLIILTEKATSEQLKQAASDFDGYVKVVVDVEKQILTAGGKRHFDGEQLLLKHGSKQTALWGGGVDLNSREIDYNSVINLRPREGNSSRDILDISIRNIFDTIVRKFLLS